MKGYRTVIAGFLVAGLGALQQSNLVNIIPQEYLGFTMSFIGFLMIVLRYFTTTPMMSNDSTSFKDELKDAVTSAAKETIQAHLNKIKSK